MIKLKTSGSTSELFIDQKDIKLFNNFLILFAIFEIGTFLLYLFRPLISIILSDIGIFFLVIAIFLVSKKYHQLHTGFKVVILFIIGMVLELIVGILDNRFPHSSHISPSIESILDQLKNIENGFGNHVYTIVLFVVLTGIFMFIASYFFTNWLNEAFKFEKPFKFFLYFGIINFFAEIITSIGYMLYAHELGIAIAQNDSTRIVLGGLIIFLGVILLLISFILITIAGFILYNKNKTLLTRPPSPILSEQGVMFCANCGTKLEENAKICKNCGLPVQR